jgi:hypothetical protein
MIASARSMSCVCMCVCVCVCVCTRASACVCAWALSVCISNTDSAAFKYFDQLVHTSLWLTVLSVLGTIACFLSLVQASSGAAIFTPRSLGVNGQPRTNESHSQCHHLTLSYSMTRPQQCCQYTTKILYNIYPTFWISFFFFFVLLLLLLASSQLFLCMLLLLLSQWWTPPLRLQVSDCSTLLKVCDVPRTTVFFVENLLNVVLVLSPHIFF